MQIISHRGFWSHQNEQNNLKAFENSLLLGFGIEVDIRDFKGDIAISHDLANEESLKLRSLLELYKNYNNKFTLAFNIKSDGLSTILKNYLSLFQIKNYFIFDASVPDSLNYINLGITTFTRQSEYEISPNFYDLAQGVWLDEFYSSWISEKILNLHKQNNKKICIVSPELHNREYKLEWQKYKKILHEVNPDDVFLCTDYPLEAKIFFEQND